jgi:starvation-inducible DNA-binding protein
MSSRESKLHALNVAHLRTTRNDVANPARQSAIEALDSVVATATDLALAARQAHWNVRGASFSALHSLFGEISDKLHRHVDELAERSAALGGIPRCTVQAVAATTALKPYPGYGFEGSEHIEQLSERMAVLSSDLRQASLELEGARDPVTAHLLVEACASVDHLLWQLESHMPVDHAPRSERGG